MVKLITIRKSCRKICPDVEKEDCFGFKKDEFSALKLSTILKDIPGFVNVDSDRILEWFYLDYTKPCHMVLSDSEIVHQE
jgi:hypothetical protein